MIYEVLIHKPITFMVFTFTIGMCVPQLWSNASDQIKNTCFCEPNLKVKCLLTVFKNNGNTDLGTSPLIDLAWSRIKIYKNNVSFIQI